MKPVKRGRGRPSQGERVDIRIPTDLLRRVDRDAHRGGISRAEQIRRIITNHYTPVDATKRPPPASNEAQSEGRFGSMRRRQV